MKIVAGAPQQINVKPLISTGKFGIKAEVDKSNLIVGFKITIFEPKKEIYIPVERKTAAGYWKAWEKVYNSVKTQL